jgi:Holliday junction resolvasome RuvABC endonuclease subunit
MLAGEYTPMQVKLHVTGYGKAEKPEVQWAVAKLLRLARKLLNLMMPLMHWQSLLPMPV